MIAYKKIENHNPVMVQRFGADPWAMVYKDRVYLYMTGDEPVIGKDGKPGGFPVLAVLPRENGRKGNTGRTREAPCPRSVRLRPL